MNLWLGFGVRLFLCHKMIINMLLLDTGNLPTWIKGFRLTLWVTMKQTVSFKELRSNSAQLNPMLHPLNLRGWLNSGAADLKEKALGSKHWIFHNVLLCRIPEKMLQHAEVARCLSPEWSVVSLTVYHSKPQECNQKAEPKHAGY